MRRMLRSAARPPNVTRYPSPALQQEAASLIGVDKTTVFNWENGIATPSSWVVPGVLAFLGCDPTETGSTLGERLRSARRRLGLSHADLAERLGVDPSSVLGWERGRHQPTRQRRERIAAFIGQVGPRSQG